jgi:hypothetical protein
LVATLGKPATDLRLQNDGLLVLTSEGGASFTLLALVSAAEQRTTVELWYVGCALAATDFLELFEL